MTYDCDTCKKFPCRELIDACATISNETLSITLCELFKGFIKTVGCASHSMKSTCANNMTPSIGVTICYRCGDCCSWLGENKTYPRLLDFDGHPSCPADSPMPKEFRDDGP